MLVKMFKSTVESVEAKSNYSPAMCHLKVGNKSKSRTKGMSLASLKLTVAFELKAEGYIHIELDKVVKLNDLKVKVHVLGEDELGARLAVLCINRLERFNSSGLANMVEVVQRSLGEEGDVAIAIPIGLLEEAKGIFGITNRVFLVDGEYRVWSHSCDSAYTSMIKYAMLRQHQCALSEENGKNLKVNLEANRKTQAYLISLRRFKL